MKLTTDLLLIEILKSRIVDSKKANVKFQSGKYNTADPTHWEEFTVSFMADFIVEPKNYYEDGYASLVKITLQDITWGYRISVQIILDLDEDGEKIIFYEEGYVAREFYSTGDKKRFSKLRPIILQILSTEWKTAQDYLPDIHPDS